MEFVPVMTLPSGELQLTAQTFLLTEDERAGMNEQNPQLE